MTGTYQGGRLRMESDDALIEHSISEVSLTLLKQNEALIRQNCLLIAENSQLCGRVSAIEKTLLDVLNMLRK